MKKGVEKSKDEYQNINKQTNNKYLHWCTGEDTRQLQEPQRDDWQELGSESD